MQIKCYYMQLIYYLAEYRFTSPSFYYNFLHVSFKEEFHLSRT